MISVRNLDYSYPKQANRALSGLNFEIGEGEIFGFLGPSGAGKSTTQKILYKLLGGYSGEVRIAGRELGEWGQDFYERIGVGFELPNHYLKLTARENLEFFGAFYSRKRASVLDLLAMVGLEKDADKRVAEFSKGMKMRLNFVRAFMHDPEILFFDEPTSGLDPTNAHLVKGIIEDLRRAGKTIFITTHQMHDAEQLCGRVAFLVDGKILALDSPEALKLRYAQERVEVLRKSGERVQFDMQNLADNEEFMHILRANDVATIHSQEASLEDVFIQVTGRGLQ